MNCKQLRKMFDPTVETEKDLSGHLDGCPACFKYVSEMRRLHALLAADGGVPVPIDFDRRLQERLDRVRRSPVYWWRFVNPRVALPIAAIVLVTSTVLTVMKRSDEVLTPTSGVATIAGTPAPSLATPSERTETGEPQVGSEGDRPGLEDRQAARLASSTTPGPDRRLRGELPWIVGPAGQQVILRIVDESNQHERLVTIPSMLIGAKPVFNSIQVSQNEVENVF